MVNHSIHFIGIPKRIRLWEVQSNVVRMFVTMNGEVPKYHEKILFSARLFLECFMAVQRRAEALQALLGKYYIH